MATAMSCSTATRLTWSESPHDDQDIVGVDGVAHRLGLVEPGLHPDRVRPG